VDLDLLVRGGSIVDGTGAPAFPADLGVRGDRIVALGAIPDADAGRVIDATGRVVAPGFIDVHVHSEMALRGSDDRYGSVHQGVTTHLTGADGFGWAPLDGDGSAELWRSTVFASGAPDLNPSWPTIESYLAGYAGVSPVNVVPMAPHQAIRFAVLGWDPRPADTGELEQMKALTRAWLDAGAVGLNTGLDYQPAASVSTDEIVELVKVVGERGGIYAAHMRYQGLGRVGAWKESIEIGRRSGVPVRISHDSVDDDTEPLLDDARREIDLSVDWYLYPAGSSHLLVMLPPRLSVGSFDGVIERLKDPAYRAEVTEWIERQLRDTHAAGGREYFSDTKSGRYIGQSIADVAAERGRPLGETAVDLLIEESPEAILIFKRGTPPDVFEALSRRTIAHPGFSVSSDGVYNGVRPHPRGYGCFARVFRVFVRELGAISLEEAVHKMSGLPAERFRIRDRGRLAEGFGADLVVFDPATVGDRATWEEPRLESVGIDAVVVNGEIVVESGRPTGALPGRVLRPLLGSA
jgi:N-acyl-D-amino-acid deacylase